jgi:MFS family permease
MMTTYNIYLNRFLGDFIPIAPLIGVLLVSQNITLSGASLVFFALAASVMAFEIPGGLLADRIALKYVLVASRLLKLSAFTVIFFEPSLAGFILGAILWGGASALDSGAFQSYLFCYSRERVNKIDFDHTFARAMTAGMFGLLAAAGATSLVGMIGLNGLQLLGLGALSLCLVSALLLPHVQKTTSEREERTPLWTSIVSALQYIKLRPALLVVVTVGILSGAIKGSLDEYTSILLLEAGALVAMVGVLMFALEILKTGSAVLAPYISLSPRQQTLVLGALGLCFAVMGLSASLYVVFALLAVIIVIDATLWIHNDTYIQKSATDSNRATLASFKNFFTESISLLVFLFAWLSGDSLVVTNLYIVLGFLLVLFTAALLLYSFRNGHKYSH